MTTGLWQGHRRLAQLATAVLVLVVVTLTERSASAQFSYPTIDFETINNQPSTDGIAVTTQYSPAVVFQFNPTNPTQLQSPPASPAPFSGNFVLEGPVDEIVSGPIVMNFPQPMSLVQLYGGAGCGSRLATLTGYNCQGTVCNVVAGPETLSTDPGMVDVLFMVGTNSPEINQAVFDVGGNCVGFIDNLTLTGVAAGPPPPPPTIQITSPNGNVGGLVPDALTVNGLYSGTNLYQLQIDLISLNTQSGQPSTQSTILPLQGNATNMPFSQLLAQAGAFPFGNFQIVATVTDGANQQAQATVNINHFNSYVSGVDQTYGNFLFGVNDPDCRLGFYQNGAIAQITPVTDYNGPAAIFIPEPIAQKWLTVNSPMLWPYQTLGCPTANAATVSQNWQIQEFEHGRIYAPPQNPAVWVPDILRIAMANILRSPHAGVNDELTYVGFPMGDPDFDLDVTAPTWFFQRFSQQNFDPITGPPTWNTLEIRGRNAPATSSTPATTPMLYVERIGGDQDELADAQADMNGKPTQPPVVGNTTPTVWQEFPCLMGPNDDWPSSCDLSSLTPEAGPGPESYNIISGLCGNNANGLQARDCDQSATGDACSANSCNTYAVTPPAFTQWALGSGGKAWASTASYTNLSVYQGIIRNYDHTSSNPGSEFSTEDHPLDHLYCNPNLSTLDELGDAAKDLGELGLGIGECLADAASLGLLSLIDSNICPGAASDLTNYCRSDWDLHTRPLPTPGNWNFLSWGNVYVDVVDFEIEFEEAFAQSDYFTNFLPLPGDLVTIHGRQVVDCAHCPYHAEIHPPDFLAVSRSDVHLKPFSNTNDPQYRTTEAYLWANAFLPNPNGVIAPVTATVQPPPRISATAILHVFQHEPNYYKLEGGLKAKTTPVADGLQIQFSGSNPTPLVEEQNGQWIYPGSLPNDPIFLVNIIGEPPPNPPSDLTGPRFVDYWQIGWTTPDGAWPP
jgi:hypothetical protein